MDRLEMAHKIARAAGCMDWLKKSPHISDSCRAEAMQHVTELHDIATHLAGDKVHEVYGPDDSEADNRLILAAGQCMCEASDA